MIYLLALAYLASYALRAWLAVRYASSLAETPREGLTADSLTVAQAILSGDPLLESRLAENLGMLSGQRFLWLIDEADTEARRIADAIGTPAVAVILCPPCPDSTNPKLWKLQRASELARTPFFCVLDDDTTLSAESAAALMAAAEKSTVATGLPCYLDNHDIASGLLAQFVNNNSVFTYLGTACLLAPFTLNGMGYVMKREELARIGHFKPIQNELTDDLALATLVLGQGGTIHQAKAPLKVRTGVESLGHYMRLMHRWYVFTLLLLRRQGIPAQALIFGLHGLPPMILVALCVMHDLPVLGVVLLVRFFILRHMHARFFGIRLHRPFLSVLSELMQPIHLVHALAVRTIRWRTRRYRVRDTHDFQEL
jgi:ceramide glucosyltransferase